MKFDEILEHIGGFGRCQARLLVLLGIPPINVALQMLVIVFLQQTPDHRCRLPNFSNDTYEVQGPWHEHMINDTIPVNDEDGGYDSCSYYETTGISGNKTMVECDDWVSDTSVYSRTFPMDFQLLCADKPKVRLGQVVFLSGVAVGSIIGGLLADFLGRKPVFILACLLNGCAGVAAAFSPNFEAFALFRSLVGFSNTIIFNTGLLLTLELVEPSKRMLAGMLPEVTFALGLTLLTPLAYGIRDWRYLQLAVSVPSFLYIFYWWFIPESPRWLLSRGYTKRAQIILQWVAKLNKTSLPAAMISKTSLEDSRHISPLELRKAPRLLLRTVIAVFIWIVIALAYYGLTFNPGNLAGDLYINSLIMALTEFPAYFMCFVINKLGRRWPHAISAIVAGLAMICTLFLELYAAPESSYKNAIQVTLFMVGKTGVSASFAIIIMWVGEFYPTPLRNFGMGICTMFGRLGAMCAPIIVGAFEGNAKLGNTVPWIIFGVLALIAGMSSLFLPETCNRQLPETLESANIFGVKERKGPTADINGTVLEPLSENS